LRGTVANLVEVVRLSFERANEPEFRGPLRTQVLIVDDDAVANQALVTALAPAQFEVCATEDSIVAWQWINGERFDLVLLDFDMPVLDGLQLCRLLRELPGNEKTCVLLITSKDDPDTRSIAIQNGADDVICKTILPQEFTAKIVMHQVRKRLGSQG
jgi:DNA-binding response OmpR family regulator